MLLSGLGVRQAEVIEHVNDHPGDDQPGVCLVVGRDDEPRSALWGARGADAVLIGRM